MSFREILYPTDFSERCAAAAPYVLDMARRDNARVHIVHVLYDIKVSAAWYTKRLDTTGLYAQMQEGAQKELAKCHQELLGGYPNVIMQVLKGTPAKDLMKYAANNSIDLIVISSHTKRAIKRVIFGSTASQVVRSAPCPVLLLRAQA